MPTPESNEESDGSDDSIGSHNTIQLEGTSYDSSGSSFWEGDACRRMPNGDEMMNTNHDGSATQLDEATTRHGLDKEVDGTTSECVPYIGQLFSSYIDAYDYYNENAGITAFGIRRNRTRERHGVTWQRQYCCANEGTKQERNKVGKVPKFRRMNTRIGCKACMTIQMIGPDSWKVVNLIEEHNHDLLAKDQTFTLRSHRHVKECWQSIINLTEASEIRATQAYEYMCAQSGGPERLGFLPQDHYNNISARRRTAHELGEAVVLIDYLKKKKSIDKSFTYEMQLDNENCVTNIFWADGRALVDYNLFGDVVCFDTTYKTNRYGRPLGVFVGVNHHRHTVVFGTAMLYDETIASFMWLFSTFVKTMVGKTPRTIMTDQAKAMEVAIERVLPITVHQICIWHILQNVAKKLSHSYAMIIDGKKPFSNVFKKCVYEYEDEDDVTSSKDSMIKTFELGDNEWLSGIYDERKKWAMVYGRHAFSASMRTTQRSESFNGNLKKYLDSKQNLSQFLMTFDRLFRKQRAREKIVDCKNRSSRIIPKFASTILHQLAKVFTLKAYKMQEDEFFHVCDMSIIQRLDKESCREYQVESLKKKKISKVMYNSSEAS